MFHEKIQNSLKTIIQEYGTIICKEPSRLEGLLKDYCGEYKKEIFIIVSSAKDGAPGEIISLKDSFEFARGRLSSRLVDNYAFSHDYADAVILLWLLVLGKITLVQYDAMLAKNKKNVGTVQDPAQELPLQQFMPPQAEITNNNPDLTNLRHVKVGDILYHGRYQQATDKSSKPEAIAWRVLATENGKALVIAGKCLDCQPYNKKRVAITWETCTLRRWLNEEFLNRAFSASEQQAIATTTVINKDSTKYKTKGGNNTQDKIFLLSHEEAVRYFAKDSDRVSTNTAYAQG